MEDDLKVKVSVEKLINYAVNEQRRLMKAHYLKHMGAASAELCDSCAYPTVLEFLEAVKAENKPTTVEMTKAIVPV